MLFKDIGNLKRKKVTVQKTRIEITPQYNYRNELVRHLIQSNLIMMSSDDIELKEIEKVAQTASGRCLIGGLGLGLLPIEIARYHSATSIEIIENDMEVIRLVAERVYKESHEIPIKITYADITKWTPPSGKVYDWVYCDWWMEPTKEAYDELTSFLGRMENLGHIKKSTYVDGWMLDRMKSGIFWE